MLNIPDKCVGCSLQCELVHKLTNIINTGKEYYESADEVMSMSAQDINEEVPLKERETILRGTKAVLASLMDENDLEMDELIVKSHRLSDSCDGVVNLKVSRGDKQFVVGVCTSDLAYSNGCLSVHIAPTNDSL